MTVGRTARYLTAGVSACIALLVLGGSVGRAVIGEREIGWSLWDTRDGRWLVWVDRWSCGVGRIWWVDLHALGEPAAGNWYRRHGRADHRLFGFGTVVDDRVLVMTVGQPTSRPTYGGLACSHIVFVGLPMAAAVPALAGLPAAFWIRAARSRRRTRHGLCLVCGYDLRATAGRCPECGRAATSGCVGAG